MVDYHAAAFAAWQVSSLVSIYNKLKACHSIPFASLWTAMLQRLLHGSPECLAGPNDPDIEFVDHSANERTIMSGASNSLSKGRFRKSVRIVKGCFFI